MVVEGAVEADVPTDLSMKVVRRVKATWEDTRTRVKRVVSTLRELLGGDVEAMVGVDTGLGEKAARYLREGRQEMLPDKMEKVTLRTSKERTDRSEVEDVVDTDVVEVMATEEEAIDPEVPPEKERRVWRLHQLKEENIMRRV